MSVSNKKKLALISAINNNYGTMLQAYAMQKVLEHYDFDVDIFNYVSDPVKQIYRIFNLVFLKTKLKAYLIKIVTKLLYPKIYLQIKIREEAFILFKKNNLNLTERINSKNQLKDKILSYDVVLLGSDQVWNPQNMEMDYYTLNFVPDSIPKITYAPSFGVSDIPNYQKEKTKHYLSRIEHISVREISGAKIIKKLIDRDVDVVCDPTALLEAKDWDILKTNKKYTEDDYIFCYFLGNNMIHRKFANEMAKKLKCKILSIQHMDEFVKEDLKFSDLSVYDVDPGDFINLIFNARLVITDSFHGSMFSIYYKKPFYVLNYSKPDDKNSVNSRIESIIKILEIEDRRIAGNENIELSQVDKINWDDVHARLRSFRNNSFTYLNNALKKENLINNGRDIR